MNEKATNTINNPDDFAAVRESWSRGKANIVIADRDQVNHIHLPGQDIAVLVSGDDSAGKMLTINAPAGHELFFKSLAEAFASATPATDPGAILKEMVRFDTVFEPLQ